jgi:hypothetical protein
MGSARSRTSISLNHDAVAEAAMERHRKRSYVRLRYGALKSRITFPLKLARWDEDCKRAYAFRSAHARPRPRSPLRPRARPSLEETGIQVASDSSDGGPGGTFANTERLGR